MQVSGSVYSLLTQLLYDEPKSSLSWQIGMVLPE